MAKEDIHNLSGVLDRTSERWILKLHPDDQEDVRRFTNDLLAGGYSAARVLKYFAYLASIRKKLDKSFREANDTDFKRFVAQLEKSDYADWTKYDQKVILRMYLKWLGKGDLVAWLKIKSVKNGTLPEEVLAEEDVKAMAGAAYSSRDIAFIESFYESGTRIGEFLPMKLKHLSFDKYGAVFRVTGKTGDRRIRLVTSTLALQAWLNEHPSKNNPDAYLWCKNPTRYNPKWKNDHLSYGFVCRLLNELAVKAGVKKAVNPHAFRHARATFMASRLKEPEMRQFFGWGGDSEMPATYVHLSGRDIDNSVLSIYGFQEAKKSQDPVIRAWACQRCSEANDPAAKFCKKCGLPADAGNADKIEGLLVEFLQIIGDAFPQVKERFRAVVKERGAESLFKY